MIFMKILQGNIQMIITLSLQVQKDAQLGSVVMITTLKTAQAKTNKTFIKITSGEQDKVFHFLFLYIF